MMWGARLTERLCTWHPQGVCARAAVREQAATCPGFRVQGVQKACCKKGTEFKVRGLGPFRGLRGLGFRVEGLAFQVLR